jgi:hypothetical protein
MLVEVVEFWWSHIALFFLISCVFVLEFIHLRTSCSLEVLITWSLLVEIFSGRIAYCPGRGAIMIEGGMAQCQAFDHMLRALGLIPSTV